ncbi:hypothetical protein GCM10022267_75600 [Lentzea roselyniae]|uniref:Uncharacterized protein n=1 Tax=Lentzea roselyniae TaxID=531940 RepID=A0ABP7C581_9PSEU
MWDELNDDMQSEVDDDTDEFATLSELTRAGENWALEDGVISARA